MGRDTTPIYLCSVSHIDSDTYESNHLEDSHPRVSLECSDEKQSDELKAWGGRSLVQY